jgi:hypothetical protein
MSIPVKAAKALAEEHKLSQVIVFAWDGKQTHVVTYGKTVEDCAQAAAGANKIKQGWGWPESTLAEPPRVQALLDRIAELEREVENLNIRLDEEIAGEDW